jgi:hypothetical protein
MGGNAAGKWETQSVPQPRFSRLSEVGNRYEIITPRDDAHECDSQDIIETVYGPSDDARIAQIAETIGEGLWIGGSFLRLHGHGRSE